MASGLLSYRVLPFERGDGGAFKRPDAYPRSALAVVTTHDLPTFRGWWRGLDIDLRQTLGVFDRETAERERAARVAERRRAGRGARRARASCRRPSRPTSRRSRRRCATSRAPRPLLAGLQIEDAAGELNQANMPGIDQGHPNWRRRLSNGSGDLRRRGATRQARRCSWRRKAAARAPNAGALAAPPPRATYRLQFHKDFTFDDAVGDRAVSGASSASATSTPRRSQARPGSTHGYDIVDHAAINPELGGEDGFRRLSEALQAHGLGLVLDIVPNHMGVGGADNALVALGARMGRAVAVCEGLRHRLGAARRRTASSSSRSWATATARRSRRAS